MKNLNLKALVVCRLRAFQGESDVSKWDHIPPFRGHDEADVGWSFLQEVKSFPIQPEKSSVSMELGIANVEQRLVGSFKKGIPGADLSYGPISGDQFGEKSLLWYVGTQSDFASPRRLRGCPHTRLS